jgi:hypothetical protein
MTVLPVRSRREAQHKAGRTPLKNGLKCDGGNVVALIDDDLLIRRKEILEIFNSLFRNALWADDLQRKTSR